MECCGRWLPKTRSGRASGSKFACSEVAIGYYSPKVGWHAVGDSFEGKIVFSNLRRFSGLCPSIIFVSFVYSMFLSYRGSLFCVRQLFLSRPMFLGQRVRGREGGHS